ncbi:MAG TPA: alkaline phosphatase family protein [Candidatus Binatia bacterium]|nr:alkaline phosphatase family protein [Candidatus Binatia bacterium]
MSPFNHLLVVALDMADGDLIRHWSAQGRLPHFASLLSSGTWIDLESTAEVLHTSTWPTFATGTLPGKHGIYFPYQPKPGYQLAQHVQPEQYGAATFWHLADSQGCRCVIYDVPETFPEPGFRGKAIFDWGTWAWYCKPHAQPPTLLREMKSRFGRYPLGFEAKRLGASMPYLGVLEERLLRSVKYKLSTAQWLLQQNAWNLAVVGFCEAHPAGHYLWPADVGATDPAREDKIKSLFGIYSALDQAVGTLLDAVPSDGAVFVVSGDGVRANRCGWYLLPAVLERLGYTCSVIGTTTGRSASTSLIGRVKGLVPARTRRQIADLLPWRLRDRLAAHEQAANIDWAKTRAFTLPTDLEGCIRINLKGREPLGIVEPGQEYKELCEEIRARLVELTNPADGAPAIRQVWIRNEVFPGERQEQLPDLIVTWNDAAPFTSVASPRFGCIEGDTADPRPGTHSPYGFLLAAGAGVPRGSQGVGRLVDVAPTVMKFLGVTFPSNMDGTPLIALTGPAHTQKARQGLLPQVLHQG